MGIEVCPTCDGSGLDPENPDYPCTTCSGEGRIYVRRDSR